MPQRLRLTVHASIGAAFVPYLRRQIRKAHELLDPPLNEFSIALVNYRRMSDLHVQFMNIPGPTDVLTFPLELRKDGKATAGEVILCVPEARRRAKEHGVTVQNELLLYALHGMLHLCGFDDRTARGFARMHRTEDDILQRLGVGPVFHSCRASQTSGRTRGGR
jgi:probable rRNA maturation factor